jgi:hypothetical protein
VAALILEPETTRAQTPSGAAEFSWVREQGAEACPDGRAMRAAVVTRLGRDPFGPGDGSAIEAIASHAGSTWTARVTARAADGQLIGDRELNSSAPTCASLASAAALAVALVIDPDAVARTSAARAAPAPSPAAPPRSAGTAVSPSSSPTRDGLASWVDLRAVASAGLLPGFAPGIAIGTDLALARWLSLSAALSYWPEQKQRSGSGAIAFGLSAVSLGACSEPVAFDALGVALCAGALLGSIHSVIYQLIPTAPGDRLWSGLSAGARIYAPRKATVRVSFALDALAPLTRQRFTVGGQPGTAFRQSAVALDAQLGLGVRFR